MASYPIYLLVGEGGSSGSNIRKVDLSMSAVSSLTTSGFSTIRVVEISIPNDFALFIADNSGDFAGVAAKETALPRHN
jgi:hypothetical protein